MFPPSETCHGNVVSPISQRSHSRAAPRPSLIAQTIRLWPRRMSPAAKTPGTLVANAPCSALALVRVFLHAELIEQRTFRTSKAHREQHELRREHLFRTGDLARDCPAVVLDPFDADGVQFLDAALVVADEFLGLDQVFARIVAEEGGRLLLAVIHFVDLRPLRPRVVRRPLQRRLGQQLELHQAPAAVPHRRADAVGAGVAAADHDHVLALGGNVSAVLVAAVQQALGVGVQELHGEMDALEVSALRFGEEIVRVGGAAGQHDGVELLAQLFGRVVLADLAVDDELDAFRGHQIDAALDDALVELHVGDAVHQQSADAVGALEDGDAMACPVELGGGGQPGGAGADHGHLFAGAHRRRFGRDPAFLEAPIDDGALDGLDRDRRLVDAEDARTLARRRTNAAGKLREVVGLVQPFQRVLPVASVNEVVPLGDEVVDGAAGGHALDQRPGVAERHAAVHATGALFLEHGRVGVLVELLPVVDAAGRRPGQRQLARVFHETCRLAHVSPLDLVVSAHYLLKLFLIFFRSDVLRNQFLPRRRHVFAGPGGAKTVGHRAFFRL